jgi:hypothetical protein
MVLWLSWKQNGIFYYTNRGCYKRKCLNWLYLKDEIDDVISQIPEDEKELHERIGKIISIVRSEISRKIFDINVSYDNYLNVGSRKEYALQFRKKDINFGEVMQLAKADY